MLDFKFDKNQPNVSRAVRIKECSFRLTDSKITGKAYDA
jgi:hypothetical protein